MVDFIANRDALPKPWDNPLVFLLTNGHSSLEVEVEQRAAIEYQSAWRAGGIAFALAPQRTEYFVQSVEAAANRMVNDAGQVAYSRLLLKWSDLNP